MNIEFELKKEFDKAQLARISKNEGQARVCARRAAGIAVREYFKRRGVSIPSMSAYDLLNLLKEDTATPEAYKRSAEKLTLRVTEEFTLPIDADLIAEARLLCDGLLNKTDPGS